jgi:hypothetical protein
MADDTKSRAMEPHPDAGHAKESRAWLCAVPEVANQRRKLQGTENKEKEK